MTNDFFSAWRKTKDQRPKPTTKANDQNPDLLDKPQLLRLESKSNVFEPATNETPPNGAASVPRLSAWFGRSGGSLFQPQQLIKTGAKL
jgi:hypothetical protein